MKRERNDYKDPATRHTSYTEAVEFETASYAFSKLEVFPVVATCSIFEVAWNTGTVGAVREPTAIPGKMKKCRGVNWRQIGTVKTKHQVRSLMDAQRLSWLGKPSK